MPVIIEREIGISRRAFPKAQELFRGVPSRRLSGVAEVGWHGTEVHPETGAIAVVLETGPYADLVGDILRVTTRRGLAVREVFVYCVGRATPPADISLSRRAFLALGSLGLKSLTCTVEVL